MRVRASILTLALLSPVLGGTDPRLWLEGPPSASASVSILLSLDELVQQSAYVVLATATEQKSMWEDLPAGRRIVTYTRLVVENAVAGEPVGEIWVRTLGGAVGEIGQAVSGEAQITPGSRSLFFLTKIARGAVVTGMAQGHFPIAIDSNGVRKLAASPDAGALLRRRGPSISAREVLVGSTIDQAVDMVRRVRRDQDAHRK